MISKSNPRSRKILPRVGLIVIWLLLLISPIGHIVAVLTVVGWIIIFFILGLVKVQEPPNE